MSTTQLSNQTTNDAPAVAAEDIVTARDDQVGGGVQVLAELLRETSIRHDAFEKAAPPHDWWDWYGAYMDARLTGSTPDEAATAANRYMADVKHVVLPTA